MSGSGVRIVAVLTREWAPESMRPTGSLEQVYLHMFRRFTDMIAEEFGDRFQGLAPSGRVWGLDRYEMTAESMLVKT